MKKSQFSEELIAYALHEVELGTAVAHICRKMGVSEQTFYRWKKKFAGIGVILHATLYRGLWPRVVLPSFW